MPRKTTHISWTARQIRRGSMTGRTILDVRTAAWLSRRLGREALGELRRSRRRTRLR